MHSTYSVLAIILLLLAGSSNPPTLAAHQYQCHRRCLARQLLAVVEVEVVAVEVEVAAAAWGRRAAAAALSQPMAAQRLAALLRCPCGH